MKNEISRAEFNKLANIQRAAAGMREALGGLRALVYDVVEFNALEENQSFKESVDDFIFGGVVLTSPWRNDVSRLLNRLQISIADDEAIAGD